MGFSQKQTPGIFNSLLSKHTYGKTSEDSPSPIGMTPYQPSTCSSQEFPLEPQVCDAVLASVRRRPLIATRRAARGQQVTGGTSTFRGVKRMAADPLESILRQQDFSDAAVNHGYASR